MTNPASSRWQRFANFAVPSSATLLTVLTVLDESTKDTPHTRVLVALAVGLMMSLALRWRYRRPLITAVVVGVASNLFCYLAPHSLIPYAGGFAVYALAARRSPKVSLPQLFVVQLSVVFSRDHYPETDLYFVMACLAVIWALGEASRNRRNAYEQRTLRVLADERQRIARELHDVIAHSVSVIVVQAAAAGDIFETKPERSREALRDIERTGRQTLNELRSLLANVGGDAAPLDAPQPRVEDLPALMETLRNAGLLVTLDITGEANAAPGVELAAFRIVQEALTNTLRHSASHTAAVCITYGPATVDVEVSDPGPARRSASIGAGRGLIGMQERVSMLGGTIESGPSDNGGFCVHAVLPKGEDS
jgi:signal transduction histidine kinase